METTQHPLGKLAIPWVILLLLGIAWSLGSIATYLLGMYFRVGGIHSSLDPLFDSPSVSTQDDLAELLCLTVTFSLFSLLGVFQIFKKWQTLRMPIPSLTSVGLALLKATIFFAPIWLVAGWFFGKYRFDLPGDGNWLAIGTFTAIASFHWYRFRSLVICEDEEDNEEIKFE